MRASIIGKNTVLVGAFLSLLNAVPVTASPVPTATIYTDKAFYVHGDTLHVSVSCWNYAEDMDVDVYIGLFTWFGTFYALKPDGTWGTSIVPCLTKVPVKSGASYFGIPSVYYNLPATIPAGMYALGIVLTQTASVRWISELNGTFFYVAAPTPTHVYVDGTTGDDTKSGTKTDPWKTISHALQQVTPPWWAPVTIHVSSGTYCLAQNGEQYPLMLKRSVYLLGAGADTTILDAELADHVIQCIAGKLQPYPYTVRVLPTGEDRAFSIVEGFTIKKGYANGMTAADQRGGGIYCPDDFNLLAQNNIVVDNTADQGGGIYFGKSSAILHNNLIQLNTALTSGGGVHCEGSTWGSILANEIRENAALHGGGIECNCSNPEIRNNNICLNNVEQHGGGVACDGCSPWIDSNMIMENRATGDNCHGGGISCSEAIPPRIQNNAIYGNVADGRIARGGGIACPLKASPIVVNNSIVRNEAKGLERGEGGGIYCQFSSIEVDRCAILQNEAGSGGGIFSQCSANARFTLNLICYNAALKGNGGGVCCAGPLDESKHRHSTIARNSAGNGAGGGLQAVPSTNQTYNLISDCIIYENTSHTGEQLEGRYMLLCSCVEKWSGGGLQGMSGKNIAEYPKFMKGAFSEFYLMPKTAADPGSKCINTGSIQTVGTIFESMTTVPDGAKDVDMVDMGSHFVIP